MAWLASDHPHVVLYPSLAVDANTEERNERLQATLRTLNHTRVRPTVIHSATHTHIDSSVCGKGGIRWTDGCRRRLLRRRVW